MLFTRKVGLRVVLGAGMLMAATELRAQAPGSQPGYPYMLPLATLNQNCPPNVGDTPQIGPYELSTVYGPEGSFYRTPRIGVTWTSGTSRAWYFGRRGYTPPMYGYSTARSFLPGAFGKNPAYYATYGYGPPGTWFNCD